MKNQFDKDLLEQEIEDSNSYMPDIETTPQQEISQEAIALQNSLPPQEPELDYENFEVPDLSNLLPEPKTLSPQEQILQAYRNLGSAQKDYRKDLSNIGMLHAGNVIAQGFARGQGAEIGTGEALINGLKQQAKRPLDEIQEQFDTTKSLYGTQKAGLEYDEETKMADPKSDISKFVREQAYTVLRKMNPDKEYDLENMSARQIQKLPGLKDLMGQKSKGVHFDRFQGQDGKVYMGAFDNTTGQMVPGTERLAGYAIGYDVDPVTGQKVARSRSDVNMFGGLGGVAQVKPSDQGKPQENKPPEYSYADIAKAAPKQIDVFNQAKEKFNADMKEAREVATSITNLSSKLKPGPDNKVDSGLLGGIQTQAAKMAGQKGVLTDQDLVKFAGAGGVGPAIQRIIDGTFFGKMTDADIKFFKRFSQLMGKSLEKDIQNRSELFVDQSKQQLETVAPGITNDNVSKLLSVSKVAPAVQDTKVKVKNLKTGQVGNIPKENLEKAIKSGQYEEVK